MPNGHNGRDIHIVEAKRRIPPFDAHTGKQDQQLFIRIGQEFIGSVLQLRGQGIISLTRMPQLPLQQGGCGNYEFGAFRAEVDPQRIILEPVIRDTALVVTVVRKLAYSTRYPGARSMRRTPSGYTDTQLSSVR